MGVGSGERQTVSIENRSISARNGSDRRGLWYNPHSMKPGTEALTLTLALALLVLSACGQVVTRPTATPLPSATPTATIAPPTIIPTPTPDTYTPPPTATPTVTPTPVIYRIQAGENLNIIAARFGVPHDLLRDVNGIEDERALQVGQLLVIPVGGWTGPVEPTPTVTPTPMPVVIGSVYFHPSPLGELTVLGEVSNLSPVDLEQVHVRVTLFDAADRVLGSDTTFSALDVLAPGGKSPFVVFFPDAPDEYATYQAEVMAAVPAYTGSLYRSLEVIEVTEESAATGLLQLTGRVRNVGDAEAVATLLTVTAYDQQGRVVGMRTIAPEPDRIALGGGEAAFTVELLAAAPVYTYTIQTEARRAAPGGS